MTRGPLFQTRARQQTAVAIAMAAVLAGSMGIATAMSNWNRGSDAAAFDRVEMDGLSLDIPASWQRDRPEEQAARVPGSVIFHDPVRMDHRLTVLRINTAQPVASAAILPQAVDMQLSTLQRLGMQPLKVAPTRLQPGMADRAEFVAVTESQHANAVHFFVTFTPDGHTHWILHLSDPLIPTEGLRDRLDQNLLLLRTLDRSARLSGSSR